MSSGQIDMTTGEVVPAGEPLSGEVMPAEASDRREHDTGLDAYLTSPEAEETEAPQDVAYRAIVQQIINSDTVRDVLTPVEAYGLPEELDHPFRLDAWEVRASEYETGARFYAILQVAFPDTGERSVLTTGNQAILAQLISLQTKHDAAHRAYREWEAKGSKGKAPEPVFPLDAKVVEIGKPNRFGNKPLRLVTPDWKPRERKGARV